jgi:hypothetical protein
MMASSNVVNDPDQIVPGMLLTIPNLRANLKDAGAESLMKHFYQKTADRYREKYRTDKPMRFWYGVNRDCLQKVADTL